MKINKFKKLVKSACKDVSLQALKNEIVVRNLKKMKNLKYTKLEMQTYLTCGVLTITQKKIYLMQEQECFQSSSILAKKVPCFGCGQSDDTDRHLLECAVLKMACPDLMENTVSVYNDVFSSDMTKVQKVANLLKSALRAREILRNDDYC